MVLYTLFGPITTMFWCHLVDCCCVLVLCGKGLCLTAPKNISLEKQGKYIVYQDKKIWDDARDFCDEHDMALAHIMTYKEHKALTGIITTNNLLPRDEKSGYWLGARAYDKIWRWEFNEENPRDDHFMAGWHWHKPDYDVLKNGEVGECMELQYINPNSSLSSLGWNNLWCDEKRGFICQVVNLMVFDSSEED